MATTAAAAAATSTIISSSSVEGKGKGHAELYNEKKKVKEEISHHIKMSKCFKSCGGCLTEWQNGELGWLMLLCCIY